jgi:UDP-4-amino-4,6-dideoxy-N-acetyl-beta-L-altrosamine N-acetyltransferase
VLRPATTADQEAIRRWRNHPQVRAVSLTTHEIPAEEHAAWWSRTEGDPTRRCLVYERSGVPSGVVNITGIEGGAATWGFFLDLDGLEERGETLPAWTQVGREAVAYAFDELGLQVLYGEVLASNEAVRRMNRLWGFAEAGPRSVVVDGVAQEVFDITLRADQRRGRRGRAT